MQRENTSLAHDTGVSSKSAFEPQKRISTASPQRRHEKNPKQKFSLMHFTAGMQQETPEKRVLCRSPHCSRVAMLFSTEGLLSVFPWPATEATEVTRKKHVKILTCISYEAILCLLA